jgi:hypothetical protein
MQCKWVDWGEAAGGLGGAGRPGESPDQLCGGSSWIYAPTCFSREIGSLTNLG